MKIQASNQNSLNFNGYKNIVSRELSQYVPNERTFAYMTMQLDNAGVRDLQKWQEIQRDVFNVENPTDMITFTFLSVPGFKDFFWVGDKLLRIKQRNADDLFTDGNKKIFRVYTFIAKLTERIMNDNDWLRIDKNRYVVAANAANALERIFTDRNNLHTIGYMTPKQLAANIVADSFIREDFPQQNAGIFNHKISEIMDPYFED